MNRQIKHIAFLIIFWQASLATAQNMFINVPNKLFVIENSGFATTPYNIKVNDSIEFYYDSLGVKLALASKQVWTNTDLNFSLPQNTLTTGINGYRTGDQLYIKIFDHTKNCRFISSAVFSKKNNTGQYSFLSGAIDTLNLITIVSYSFDYPKDTICRGETSPQIKGLIIDNYPPFAEYSSSPSGLVMGFDGSVSYELSTPGHYQVTMAYKDYCLSNNSPVYVTVLPAISLNKSNLVLNQNVCGQNDGELTVNFNSSYPPVTYTFLKSGIEQKSSNENFIKNISEGSYEISVVDRSGCKASTSLFFECYNDMEITILGKALDKLNLAEGDLIEISFDSLGQKFKTVGSTNFVTGENISFYLTLDENPKELGKNSFYDGDLVYLKISNSSKNCTYLTTKLFSKTDNSGAFRFKSGTRDTIVSLDPNLIQLVIPQDSICKNNESLSLIGVLDPSPIAIYSASPPGLNISTDGIVNHFGSLPLTYKINVNFPYCINNNGEISISILNGFTLDQSNLSVKSNACSNNDGYIKINPPSNAYKPLQYELEKNNTLVYAGILDSIGGLSDGIHKLQISDKYGCEASFSFGINCKSNNAFMQIVLNSKTSLSEDISIGDTIGAYYDSLGLKKVMASSIIWNGQNATFDLDPNTASIGKNGFNENDTIYFRSQKVGQTCFFKLVGQLSAFNNSNFNIGTIDTLSSLLGIIASYEYKPAVLCNGSETSFISLKYKGRLQKEFIPKTYNFRTTKQGLNINPIDGVVNWKNSLPGTYEVVLNSDVCLSSYEASIQIIDTFGLSLSNLKVIEPKCGLSNGSIEVTKSNLGGLKPYSFIYQSENNVVIDNGFNNIFENLEANKFKLSITDSNNCKSTLRFELICISETKNIPDNFILSPTSNTNKELAIECDGMIQILNSRGRIVKKYLQSAIWDGTDEQGTPLPTGLYLIYCNEVKIGEVTIIR